MKNFHKDTCGSGSGFLKIQATTRPDYSCNQNVEKHQWAVEKPRKLGGISFIDPENGSSRKPLTDGGGYALYVEDEEAF